MRRSIAAPTSISPTSSRRPVGAGIALSLALIVTAWLSCVPFLRPQAVAASAPATDFSAERARQYLQPIASEPHPIGSDANARVRDYLLQTLRQQGLTPEVQDTTVTRTSTRRPTVTRRVQNIIARIPGSGAGQSVALVAHYDSVPDGPGASDNGVAVAALLETARALRAGPPLAHDVLILMTDGEEAGLLGAKGFVDQSPLARNVGLMLNFEARGTTGASYMFEATDNNGWLIPQFARAASHPAGYSFTFEIYRILPNNSDFTELRRLNIPGLNFAFLNGFENYHTDRDNLARVDLRSMQHHGSHMLSLARHFANIDLVKQPIQNVVYFTLPGPVMLYYPQSLVLPLAIIGLLLFGVLLWQGLRRHRLTVRGLLLGFAALFMSLVLVLLGTFLIFFGLVAIHRGPFVLAEQGATYNSQLYALGFIGFAVMVVALLYRWLSQRTGWENLAVGAWLWWLVLSLLTSLFLPGVSYIFSLPLLIGCLALIVVFMLEGRLSVLSREAILLIPAIVALLLCGPLIYGLFIALMTNLYLVVMVFVVLLVSFLLLQIRIISSALSWALPLVAALVAVGVWVYAARTAGA